MRYWAVCSAILLAGGIFFIDTGLSQADPVQSSAIEQGAAARQDTRPVNTTTSADETDRQSAFEQNIDETSDTDTANNDALVPHSARESEHNNSLSQAQLSPMAMFDAADWVVKSVMAGLLFLSALTWIIFIAKTLEIRALRKQARQVLDNVVHSPSLQAALKATENEKGTAAELVKAANEEMHKSHAAIAGAGDAGLKERVESLLMTIQLKARRQASKTIGIVATIGSVSPFIGLFGTVWGIMNSFIGIAETQSTGLSTVAPGIAEALLATAIGLFAAIPATVIYNNFVRSIAAYKHGLTDISAAIARLVSRDLDFAIAHSKKQAATGDK